MKKFIAMLILIPTLPTFGAVQKDQPKTIRVAEQFEYPDFTAAVPEYLPTTVEVAENLNYPNFINKLRGQVDDFLSRLRVSMMIDVQNLRSKDLNYRATTLQALDTDTYDTISDRFDREFDRIALAFDEMSDRLDSSDAPIRTKENFVTNLQQDASSSIQRLLRMYGGSAQKKQRRLLTR